MCSVWPRVVARPVILSVVLHSVLFWRHGEQPPCRASHLILRIFHVARVSFHMHQYINILSFAYLASITGLTRPRRAPGLLLAAAGGRGSRQAAADEVAVVVLVVEFNARVLRLRRLAVVVCGVVAGPLVRRGRWHFPCACLEVEVTAQSRLSWGPASGCGCHGACLCN